MTTIKLIENEILDKLVCNGRVITYDPRITNIKKVGAGKWQGTAGGEPFEITGGRASGGTSREWFVKWAPAYGEKYVPFNSAKRALLAIENC